MNSDPYEIHMKNFSLNKWNTFVQYQSAWNGWKPWTIFTKSSILDVSHGSEYSFGLDWTYWEGYDQKSQSEKPLSAFWQLYGDWME